MESEYKAKEFDYDFPDGLKKLLKEKRAIAILTSDGDNVTIDLKGNNEKLSGDFDKIITQWLDLELDDEILILSHAEFTQICNNNKGDYKIYGWL